LFSRFGAWLDAMPHPACVCEIAVDHVAAARWNSRNHSLEAEAREKLDAGILNPSPVDANVLNGDALRGALRHVCDRVAAGGQAAALLVPDPVVRVFILPFETLPRSADEALPLLRWRLKKSVPFDVEDTSISAMRQTGRTGGLEVVTAIARQKIVRESEEAVESLGLAPGVVLSSTLACLPLLGNSGANMLVRVSGKNLTTVIVRGSTLCVYRSVDLTADAAQLDVRALLEEVFPAAAYFQDTWGGDIDRVLLSGFAGREEIMRRALSDELHATALPFTEADSSRSLPEDARTLLARGGDALVGWMANGL